MSETCGLNRLSECVADVVNSFFKVVDKVICKEGGGRDRGWSIRREENVEKSFRGSEAEASGFSSSHTK